MSNRIDFWILMLLIVAMAIGFGYKMGNQAEKIAWCESKILKITEEFYEAVKAK